MNKFSEQEQRELFIEKFSISDSPIYKEIPVYNRSVDLVKHNITNHTISAIEFKTKNWKRAVQQVLDVSISFDFLEICIEEPKTPKAQEKIRTICDNLGIGVYFFNQETLSFTKSIESKKVESIWESQREKVIEYLGEESIIDENRTTEVITL